MSERENGWYWHTDDFGGSTLCRWVASSGRLVIGRFDSRMGGGSYRDDQLTPVARPAEVAALRADVARLREAMNKIARDRWEPRNPRASASEQITDMITQIIECAAAALEPTR